MEGDGFLSSLRVVPLPEDFTPPPFDCGEPDLTDYLCDGSAAADQRVGYSRCYLVTLPDGHLVGYFAVLADSIRLRTKERPKGVRYPTAPAVKLGRMGVDNGFRGRGVGTWILHYVVGLARSVAEEAGVRYVTLDALRRDSLVSWYQRYGFVRNEGEADREIAVLKFLKRFKDRADLVHTSMRFDILLEEELRPGPQRER
ncbi:MAG: GNAT family N-acetyltransferase [Longimicrobiales bacterium]|nr:GNAT family N-acetyltransferase [Longimicrobiales bacterium]